MRLLHVVFLGVVLATACASSGPAIEHARLDHLGYSIPAGWSSQDLSAPRTRIVVWTPADNTRKESVTVMRTEALSALANAGVPRVERLLEQAQHALPRSSFGPPVRFTTRHGFAGVRVEGELVPPAGTGGAYRRIHAVLIDGSSLVHVLYSARTPDREAFEVVIDSLRREV